ncbi:haloacid dehalogenase-like hydrolase [Pontibacter sp. E15-1]|uniref:HAD family hydrolase n=1 Tax=Pontibacter sp. E15-1 TaxID=2919918 RepID=UPI001F4FDC41|nr:HAD family hydrolase [Pontibacter sp. E15-1]MCJ8164192.1 haloacid dehalogenase-like hydrolase [Pontibacter sp. E15-1]
MTNSEAKLKVIVFDLNKTFYNKSSKDKFFEFICTKRPKRIRYFLEMTYYKLLRNLHRIRKTEFKENFFNYLDDLTPAQVEEYATEFWNNEYPGQFNQTLKNHFDQKKKQGFRIFCATGGLELYVAPLFKLYPIDGFAGTQVRYDSHTYKVIGKACKDEEKIERLKQHFKGDDFEVVEAYSDSKEAILDIATKAFLLKDGKIEPYQTT